MYILNNLLIILLIILSKTNYLDTNNIYNFALCLFNYKYY